MEEYTTISELTKKTERVSTEFEKTNNELKRRYLIWNIEAFKIIASNVTVNMGAFGTGYPFYALDKDLKGTLPIIQEQIRYNRQLVKDGEPFQKSIWRCKSCLERNYRDMPDMKKICRPCPNMVNELKPRKIINRLPDFDMWLVCKDDCMKQAQIELIELLKKHNMCTSDVEPLSTLDDIEEIATLLKRGELPKKFLPIDLHIIEYSKIKELIEEVPETLNDSKKHEIQPYLPIQPKSYRKNWQYDDEAYNFIYDYLSAFTPFNFPTELENALNDSRSKVVSEHKPEELFDFLMKSATKANFRRFQSTELEECFIRRVDDWKNLKINCHEEKIKIRDEER